MDELREKIIEAIAKTPSNGGGDDTLDGIVDPSELGLAADRILAIPEIAAAIREAVKPEII